MKIGDLVQIIYKRAKTSTIEVVQANLVDVDSDWLYLSNGKKYNKSKVENVRNLTRERAKPEDDDEE